MDLKERLQEMEEQVSGIKDPELRKIAFEKILNSNLGTGSKSALGAKNKNRPKKSYKTPHSKSNKMSHGGHNRPELKLTEEDLNNLRIFFAKKENLNGHDLVYNLCNFLRINKKMEEFSATDINAVYDSLIPLNIKVVPLQHVDQTLRNLCSKSRKKMWLEKQENGLYRVSRIGKIHWQDLQK